MKKERISCTLPRPQANGPLFFIYRDTSKVYNTKAATVDELQEETERQISQNSKWNDL